ncbi:hypothetical protein HPB48_000178 [Haemaphysalis longicornis]|uniref:SWIM-type domain-containing protein n=1 Tax=Haemaphysalis longicornis TaxID=44386 RepID=A0A9J6FLI2_HAELO|nr:hypothetical protein HPB48_000178 [Haemaphysalis longicornis]
MLRPGMDTAGDVDLFRRYVTATSSTTSCFLPTSFTLEEMKAFKSTEAHNYFTSGWVKSLSAKQLQDDKVLLLGEVNHSQRLRDQPLHVWSLCQKSGVVLTAHCTCMAGAREACFHVGACLYAVENRREDEKRYKLHFKNEHLASCVRGEGGVQEAKGHRLHFVEREEAKTGHH